MDKKTIRLGMGILLLLLPSIYYGQTEYRGRVQGVVTDASQAIVPGATVTLTNVDTNVRTVRQTDSDGRYLFDLVLPGRYSVTVEAAGFAKFIQANVQVESRGDVTANAVLKVGGLQQSVEVTATPVAVQFNSSKVELTINKEMADVLPQIHRQPFLLAELDPAVENPNDGQSEYEPYNSWGVNHLRVGGGLTYTNGEDVDGAQIAIGTKGSYVPTPDSVENVVVQQNEVDAEYGHSSGSAISLVTKSGTNTWHGDLFYQGQYPWANAMEDRTVVPHLDNIGRNHIFGATLGNPIKKDKLFNFFSWEQWRKTDPSTLFATLPTDRERQGDFSQSLNSCGSLRTIYDPTTSVAPTVVQDPCQPAGTTTTVTRTPFASNVITNIDPVAAAFMSKLWKPTGAGIGPYHVNNYASPLPVLYPYKNFTDRVDFNASDNLRIFGRLGLIRTLVTTSNPTGSPVFVSDRGSDRDSTLYSGNVTYTLSTNTVLDAHGNWYAFHDDATSPLSVSGSQGWGQWWPNSSWYTPLFQNKQLPVFIPRMEIHSDPGTTRVRMGMGNGYWYQQPDGDSFGFKLSHQEKSHYLKWGFDTVANRAQSFVAESPGFGFFSDLTSSTYTNPDISSSGDGYATFLLGALEAGGWGWGGGQTVMPITPVKMPATRAYAGFVNDDWKVSRRLTLNLGLRYEFEQAFNDPVHHLPRPFDPTNPIPEIVANPPVMPAALSQYYTGKQIWDGAYNFTSASHPSEWNSGGTWSPRFGLAFRLNDKTALRAAWAQYYTPWVKLIDGHNYLDVGYPGFDATSYAEPTLQGVPQEWLQNPFPASWPLVQPVGQSLGRYTYLGDSVSTVYGNRPHQRSDRINFTLERQLPDQFVVDVTYYFNLTNAVENQLNLNMADPRLSYKFCPPSVFVGGDSCPLDQPVQNPFFNYLTPDKFPGPLRYQQQVALGTLAKPYPQYGDIILDQYPGGAMHYQSLQLRLQRAFSKGYTLLGAYNYHYETDTVFFDDVATYLRHWTWQPSGNSRHRLSLAGVWDLPVGRGKAFLGGVPQVVNQFVGGWTLNSILSWRSGDFLQFGSLLASGNPVISNPTPNRWFNTSVFSVLPPGTERTNPWQYSGLTGPGLFNLDASLGKNFAITEKVKLEFQIQTFNTLNQFTYADPSTDIGSGVFGMTTDVLRSQDGGAPLQPGRRTQFGMRLIF